MSLGIPLALKARFDGHQKLQDWAAAHGQAVPRVVVAYRQPRTAQDWPFVSLVIGRDRIEPRRNRLLEQGVVIICGVRDPDGADDGSDGLAMLDALDMAVIGMLAERSVVNAGEGAQSMHAFEAALTDIELKHPNYLTERLVTFKAPGV